MMVREEMHDRQLPVAFPVLEGRNLMLATLLPAGGLIFNWLNEKLGCIYGSWLTHMFANFAINTIGFLLLK